MTKLLFIFEVRIPRERYQSQDVKEEKLLREGVSGDASYCSWEAKPSRWREQ